MKNVEQAIRDAAEKGGYRYRWWKVNDLEHNEGYNGLQLRALSEHLQDPDFWKALSTARKWEDANAWRFHWLGVMQRSEALRCDRVKCFGNVELLRCHIPLFGKLIETLMRFVAADLSIAIF
jgi:hypothetical protein